MALLFVLHPASVSKQELAQLLRGQLKGKYGNLLCSDIRISNPASRSFLSCGSSLKVSAHTALPIFK